MTSSMKLCVDTVTSPELVQVDTTSVDVRWSPAEVSVHGVDGDVADSNFVISYLVQMQLASGPCAGGAMGATGGTEEGDNAAGNALLPCVSEDGWCRQYWGPATHVHVKGLRPGKAYALRVQCYPSLEDGSADVDLLPPSETLLFRTKSAVPAPMLPPVLLVKNKTSLKLHLAEPEEDGGHPVTDYVVEGTVPTKAEDFDSVQTSGGMREIYRGPERTFLWSDLVPGMRYSVRAKAVNCNGAGAFSSIASFLTQSAAPDVPSGLLCMPTPPDMLTLRWDKPRSNGADIQAYVVELDDKNGQFRSIARIHVCSLVLAKLRVGNTYRMRVCAENSEGRSDWSPVVVHQVGGQKGFEPTGNISRSIPSLNSVDSTSMLSNSSVSIGSKSSEKPGTPRNLRHERLKNSSVFVWDPVAPGVAEQTFILEIAEVDVNKSAAHIWKVRYKSEEPRHEIHTLKSDLKYQVSVKSVTSAGDSSYCKTILVDMKELTGKFQVPSTPKKFAYVEDREGARLCWHLNPRESVDCIFELYVAATEDLSHKKNYIRKNAFTLLYRGEDMSHTLGTELAVGKHYTARVRSMRGGKTSEWSQDVAFELKHASWSAKVSQLHARDIKATSVSLEWAHIRESERLPAASTNTKAVISYAISLEFVGGGHQLSQCQDDRTSSHVSEFKVIQAGVRDRHATVDVLQPDSEYRVRVRAHCGSAHGPWSEPITITTAPALLSPPELYLESKSQDAIVLSWNLPTDRKGQDVVTGIELQETKLSHFEKAAPRTIALNICNRYVASGLTVGSLYGYRIRLESRDGMGSWSRPLQVETEAGPPNKPRAPLISPGGVGNAFKVNWRHPHDNGSSITDFELSLARGDGTSSQFRVVYQGPDLTTRVQNLEFGTKYSVRVRASNSCGHGPWSDPTAIETLLKPPEPPEQILADIQENDVLISWKKPRDTSNVCAGYDLEVKGQNSDKSRSERKLPMVLLARKTCNASLTSCTIHLPAYTGEISIRIRSIGGQSSGHGPWSSPLIVDYHGVIERPRSVTTSPTTSQISPMMSSKSSSDKEVHESGSPVIGSKRYRRKAFQKTAKAKQPKARFSLSSLIGGARLSRFDFFVFFFLFMMLIALYQTTMDVGFLSKPMRPKDGYDSMPRATIAQKL